MRGRSGMRIKIDVGVDEQRKTHFYWLFFMYVLTKHYFGGDFDFYFDCDIRS